MANTRKTSLSSRPVAHEARQEAVSDRPTRTPVSGHRNILTIKGKDPAYEYRFVKDVTYEQVDGEGKVTARPGQRLMRFQEGGWQFVGKDEVEVGENKVYRTENMGAIVRIPSGGDEYLYLMKIHKDWYEEDQEAKAKQMLDPSAKFSGSSREDGMYGSISVEHK